VELRRNPARRAGLAGLAALLVFGASACSGGNRLVGTSPAATVDGTDISQDQVFDAVEATKRFYEYSIEEGQDSSGELAGLVDAIHGTGSSTIGTEPAAKVLTELILDEVLRQDLAEHDALPSKQDIAAVRSEAAQQVGGEAKLKKIPQGYLNRIIESEAMSRAFTKREAAKADAEQKPYTPEEREQQKQAFFQQYYADNPLCLNAIQTSTEDEAKQARQRIDAGEDFVTVAKSFVPEGSTIPDEGSIACLTFDQAEQVIGSDVSGAKVGDLFGPVAYSQSQGAQPTYLVLKVEQTDGYTYDEVEPLIDSQVPNEPAAVDETNFDVSAARAKVFERTDIEVNPLFGRWSATAQSVIPPQVPGATTTTTTTLPATTGS